MGVVLGVLLGAVMLIPLLFYFKRRDTLKHRMLMMAANVDGQTFEANTDVQGCPPIEKSSFVLNQHLHNEMCSWYAQDGNDSLKTNCCATPTHQIHQQTLITSDDCWSHCPPRNLPDKKQTYMIKAPIVDYLEHDYDCPK